jgi:hypothetical protein
VRTTRAISLAVLGKRVGATTVEGCGQRIIITCGVSGGLTGSATMRSLPLILPTASALLGTRLSRRNPSRRGPFRSSHLLEGPAIGSRKPGLEVIAKVRLTQCLQLILLCQWHHTLVHEGGVMITEGSDGWISARPDDQLCLAWVSDQQLAWYLDSALRKQQKVESNQLARVDSFQHPEATSIRPAGPVNPSTYTSASKRSSQ